MKTKALQDSMMFLTREFKGFKDVVERATQDETRHFGSTIDDIDEVKIETKLSSKVTLRSSEMIKAFH